MTAKRRKATKSKGAPANKAAKAPEDDSPVPQESSAAPAGAASDSSQLLRLKGELLSKLLRPDGAVVGSTEEGDKASARVYHLLHTTVVHGQGGSALLLAPRGGGKTRLVRAVLEKLQKDTDVQQRGFHAIFLSGLVHTDDAAALRHVARALQLDVQRAAGDDESTQDGAQSEGKLVSFVSNAAETAHAVRSALQSGSRSESKPLLVIVEEFDLYAHGKQQTLLYTLLDTIHSGAVPLFVLGLSSRLDVATLLEKRVLSRFSNQQIFCFNAWTMTSYAAAFRSMLMADVDEDEDADTRALREEWNAKAAHVCDSATVQRELEDMFNCSRSDVRPLQQLAAYVIAQSSATRPHVCAEDAFDFRVLQAQDAKVAVLLSASALELCLVIAMNNLAMQGFAAANFEQVYACYRQFAGAVQREAFDLYSRPIALRAYEHLCDMELVQPADGRAMGQGALDGFRNMQLMLTSQQVFEVINKCSTLSTRVKMWAKSHGLTTV